MMMSKEEEAPAVAAPPAPAALNVGSVADLERRLAEMGSPKNAVAAAPPPSAAAAPTPAPVVVAAPAPALKGGKNALLARIMAAKEKQNRKTAPPPAPMAPPPPAADLLKDFDAPSTANNLPPPAYETNFLKDVPPPAFETMEQPPPPAFDSMEQQQTQFPPPPPIDSILPPPPPLDNVLPPPPMPEGEFFDMGMPSAPTATAPMFEDLHMRQPPPPQQLHPPPMQMPMAMPPPMEEAPLDIDESILNALEPAEREAFLEEQRKILAQIEQEKSNNAASGATARAMAFDQRSSSAVANVAASYERGGRSSSSRSRPSSSNSSNPTMVNLGGESGEVAIRGTEETEKAIADGTAVIVKCMSCDNWMQVTEAAELMFCPTCGVVCPVEKTGAATTADMDAAAQLAADAELAEKLQKEEYAGAEQRRSRPSGRSRSQQSSSAQPAASASESQSWYDWMTGAPAAPPPASRSSATSGVSSRSPPSRTSNLVSAQTGEEARTYNAETVGLMDGGGSGGARVAAAPKSMFSCVADSMSGAVTQMYTFNADEEGNVHGVNSQGLLAMPDVSRQREN